MAIFIGQFGDSYAERLAKEYSQIADYEEAEFYPYCFKEFRGGEYKIRIVDEHCGKSTFECDNTCRNPHELGKKIENEDVFFVVRGHYGTDWNSDRLLGIALQGAEILKSGGYEYFGGRKAKRLYLVMPHEPYTKQDHLFTDEKDGVVQRIEGEPVTIKMNRRMFKDAGYDLMFTVYPHDYRRDG